MKLIVTIDTEEDNWGQYDLNNYTTENIGKIDLLQELFDRYDVKPTYLITYAVATDNSSIKRLRRIMEDGRCEIATHCHPWATPPFEETRNDWNSMLCNLPVSLQRQKITNLHTTITQNFGIEPTSFRAGRWGYGEEVPRILAQLGYKVDSSILAFQDWRIYGGPDSSGVFPNAFMYDTNLYEVPASAGYLQHRYKLCNKVWQALSSELLLKLKLRSVLNRLGLLDKIWLSPETSSSSQMIRITSIMSQEGYQFANMFFHSTALMAGLSPFVKSKADESQFLKKIEEYLIFTKKSDIESIKLSDAPKYV